MNKKHFDAFAERIAEIMESSPTVAAVVSNTVVSVAEEFNPLFDRKRFQLAVFDYRFSKELDDPACQELRDTFEARLSEGVTIH